MGDGWVTEPGPSYADWEPRFVFCIQMEADQVRCEAGKESLPCCLVLRTHPAELNIQAGREIPSLECAKPTNTESTHGFPEHLPILHHFPVSAEQHPVCRGSSPPASVGIF